MSSNKKAQDGRFLKGMKVRHPLLVPWDHLTRDGPHLGHSPLPGSEIYMALERGISTPSEFSSPAAQQCPWGFQEITKYASSCPGVHQPSCQFDLFINKKKWDALPADLKDIVDICAKETQLWSWAWNEQLNIKAIEEMSKKVEWVMMEKDTIIEFAKTSHNYLEELKTKFPDVKTVLDSQDSFKKDYANWRELQMVAPWPMTNTSRARCP